MAKKYYIYTIKDRKIDRTYGGAKEKADIYQLKKNKPVYVTSADWNTRGYKGKDSEVYTAIAKEGGVSKKEFKETGGYYRPNKSQVEIRGL